MKQNLPNKFSSADYTDQQPHLFTSVDIRDAGFKIAPVDTNIFPAGWHLISEDGARKASVIMSAYLKDKLPFCEKVGIVCENFSRNEHYWKNVAALRDIIINAGREVVLGVTDTEVADAQPIADLTHIHKIKGKLFFGRSRPCIVVSNRDFASGAPEEFTDITQPVFPPVSMGWYRRRKSAHFGAYDEVATKFADDNGFDPWLISAYHENCGEVNFKAREGLDCVAKDVDSIIAKIAAKYAEYGVEHEPYVFIKADSGSFGMGIMTARSGDEVLEINKKLRKKMTATKDGIAVGQVIIQEGVPTSQEYEGKTAESMVYMVAGQPVDSFLRVNDEKDARENLNSSGMSFEANSEKSEQAEIIAKLAAIAASNEK